VAISTIEDIDRGSPGELRQRRRRYGATTLTLSAIMALGVIDALDWWSAYGVDDATARASRGGYDLAVRYPTVSRPALASPFEIVVTRPGGFDGPVTIAIDQSYLEMWDENGLLPAPAAETSRGDMVEWEFDPPAGETLTVWYDARIEPAAQTGRSGSVAVIVEDETVVAADFATRLRP
jgi:hypothetical protein